MFSASPTVSATTAAHSTAPTARRSCGGPTIPAPRRPRADYLSLLAEGLIRPSALEIWVADADGSNPRQLTDNGAANFAPYWHPSGDRIIFASNMDDPHGRDFELYVIKVDGTGLERVTFSEGFDGFPVFHPDGTSLVFGSNRNMSHEGNTNLFLVEWLAGK